MLVKVEKMTCNHCVRTVTAALRGLEPRAEVKVDLSTGTVSVQPAVKAEAAIAALREEGYAARVLEQ